MRQSAARALRFPKGACAQTLRIQIDIGECDYDALDVARRKMWGLTNNKPLNAFNRLCGGASAKAGRGRERRLRKRSDSSAPFASCLRASAVKRKPINAITAEERVKARKTQRKT